MLDCGKTEFRNEEDSKSNFQECMDRKKIHGTDTAVY